MDRLAEFLDTVEKLSPTQNQFRGLLHILIGRTIEAADGTVISKGQTWREAAALLKRCRWDKSAVIELGLEARELPPRDRERYWYSAIQHADLEGELARQAGDMLAQKLAKIGYRIHTGPASK